MRTPKILRLITTLFIEKVALALVSLITRRVADIITKPLAGEAFHKLLSN